MTLPLDILKELERLLAAQTAGELTDAEFEQLAALLRQSPEARNIYVAHLMLEAQLEQEHLPPLTVPALQSTPHAPREAGHQQSTPHAPREAGHHAERDGYYATWVRDVAHEYSRQPLAVAILLLTMVFGGILAWNLSHLPSPQPIAQQSADKSPIPNPKSEISPPPIPNPQSTIRNPIVARLDRTKDATWDEAARPSGNELRAGQRLILKEGLAQIVFDSGATVVLEGPAELELGTRNAERGTRNVPTSNFQLSTSPNSCSLTLGKLFARVPKQAHGFTVHTPTLKIVDLGTEFAVEVGSRRSEVGMGNVKTPTSDLRPPTSTEVHVLRGEVSVQPAADSLTQASPIPPTSDLRPC